jgi:hypothetical protein
VLDLHYLNEEVAGEHGFIRLAPDGEIFVRGDGQPIRFWAASPGFDPAGRLGLARVYIKREEGYAMARAVCEQWLGELPTIYAVADVCGPDLLVEIEGIAFSRHAPGPQA